VPRSHLSPLTVGRESVAKTVIVGGTPSASLTFAADSTTERTVTAGGQTIAYRAVAGTLTVGSNDVQDAMLGPDGKALPNFRPAPRRQLIESVESEICGSFQLWDLGLNAPDYSLSLIAL
jgi:hypothetical protein